VLEPYIKYSALTSRLIIADAELKVSDLLLTKQSIGCETHPVEVADLGQNQ